MILGTSLDLFFNFSLTIRAHHHHLTMLCRATLESLLEEYKACESADYVSYVRFLDSFMCVFFSFVPYACLT